MSRLFLALVPPPESTAALDALPRPDTPGVRWVDPRQWHVTLRFLGRCEVAEAVGAVETARLPHVTPRLGPTVTLLGPKVLVLPVTGVEPLHTAVLRATRAIGEPPDSRPYRPHLTLARLDDGVRPVLLGRPVSTSFDGSEVHLVRSETHPDGAVHETIKTWATTRR